MTEPDPMQSLPPLMRQRLSIPGADQAVAAELIPGYLRKTSVESRVPVIMALVVAIGLQVILPTAYGTPARVGIVALQSLMLVAVVVINPLSTSRFARAGRVVSLCLIGVITVDNAVSAAVLDVALLTGRSVESAPLLLGSAAAIYATNVIAFGILYWEFDRGGPMARAEARTPYPDFLFPQMLNPEITHPTWEPGFGDYLYVSFTNATAFSPTDTLPLSVWTKALMAFQSLISLTTTILVVARAVNILA